MVQDVIDPLITEIESDKVENTRKIVTARDQSRPDRSLNMTKT